jgi:hypothetical protein
MIMIIKNLKNILYLKIDKLPKKYYIGKKAIIMHRKNRYMFKNLKNQSNCS